MCPFYAAGNSFFTALLRPVGDPPVVRIRRSDVFCERKPMEPTNQHDFRGGETDLLVVEDNPPDRRLIEEVFGSSSLEVTVHGVSTSDAALDFIYQREKYADAPEPDLVFLDWKLEQTTGRDVLEALKSDQPHVPVVVLTGSKAALETDRSPTERADLLREKPTEPDEYVEILRSIAPDQ